MPGSKNMPVLVSVFILSLLFSACEQRDKSGKVVDTPTTGFIRVMVDEGYRSIIDSSLDVFDSVYRRAKIEAIYTSEGEAVNALIRDSIQVIVITRMLVSDELKFFQQRGFTPKVTPIAYDAVAFIVNPSNPDTVFTTSQLRSLLDGTYTNWQQLNPKNALGQVNLVFDNALSGTVRYAKDSIAGGKLTPNASALNTNEEVISYVGKTPGAIGVINASVISDTDDKGVQAFLKTIRIADVAPKAGATGYGPYQAFIVTGDYPYKRTVYVIDAQARVGLGQGFAAFMAGDTGQRIILKDGMVPANAVPRLIKVER